MHGLINSQMLWFLVLGAGAVGSSGLMASALAAGVTFFARAKQRFSTAEWLVK
jgi:hypothetical protein